jgi:hypothetical protein
MSVASYKQVFIGKKRGERKDRHAKLVILRTDPRIFAEPAAHEAVELSSTGPLNAAPSTAMPRMPRMRRAPRSRAQGPTYVFRCTVCGRTFNKKKMDGKLNVHKNRSGSQCYGRYGVYVRTRY